MKTLLQTFTNVRSDELAQTLVAALFFFCVLTALMVVRPAREALGMQRGIEAIRWLFIATVVVTLAMNPLFGFLVSRFRRMVFIAATYLFFAFGLVVFYFLLVVAPTAIGETSGQVFYVWFSVFNLFATMLFWALMADRFTLEQSQRLFGAIALGGTLGAIFGPWLASVLAKPLGTAAYVLIVAVIATFIYFTRLQMVAALGIDTDTRTAAFARIDLITQIATFVLQALITGHLMKRLGVAFTLALLPITVALGFIGLAIVGSLTALIVLDASFRAVQRGVMRPARETLFTVVPRSDRYKAKAFIDTFVYRGGDVIGAQTEGLLGKLGMGLAGLTVVVVPLSIIWIALGIWLGVAQHKFQGNSK